ncbi:metal ABC transporter solute-binding protein, Zn/Mn family [Marinilactibacillus kalidii]|uniref:metal ABC transporter solute-binding protein, Zn/Mn family n=1 Tax=Marinilactibacillus kalidii TaxID=2820274 RepID=UPI001ABE12A1|nr:zinc ABC transporter substrate-binding protein [Marinilactibacillus kalidii]
MKLKRLASTTVGLTIAALLVACTNEESSEAPKEEAELSIVTSFYPIHEFASIVAGDRAEVKMMVGAGDDAHHYEPSAQDVAAVNEADLFVYSSDDMETWTESLFNTIDNEELVILSAADGAILDPKQEDSEQTGTDEVMIEGASGHYHTGDMIELSAQVADNEALSSWQWFTREDDQADWETVSDATSSELSYEAPESSFEVKAVLYGENDEVFAESEPVMIEIDNHENEATHEHGEDDHDDHDHDDEATHEHGEDDHDDHDHDDEATHEHGEDDHDHEGEATHDHGHGEEPVGANGVEVVGLAGHYHSGDGVTLVAETEEAVNEWQWSTRENDQAEWTLDPDQTTEQFTGEADQESFEVQGVGLNDAGEEVANTGIVSIIVDNHENEDPHSWLDPVFVQEQVNGIRDALIEIDPDGEDEYTENAANFNAELQELDQEFQEAFEGAENRVFVVQHQAFGYIAERYDLEQIAIGGLSTEVEPSPSRIAEIGDLVEEYKVPVIYYQDGANSSIAQTVATETGTETAVLYDLESLSEELQSEDMGYIEAMKQNIESLKLSIN